MERLTFKAGGFNAFSSRCLSTYGGIQNDGSMTYIGKAADKLAEYENIGLTPGQLQEIDKLYAEKCKELAELEKKSFSGIEMVKIWAKLQKLKEYQDLEEQGKLLKLPCAVGDTVYTLNTLPSGKTVIGETTADAFMCALGMLEGRFGKTIFLTFEEAEAALKEMSE